MTGRVRRVFSVGERVLVKGPKGDFIPLLPGRQRCDRRKYLAVITAHTDPANRRIGHKVIYDGGLRPPGRVLVNDVEPARAGWVGRDMTSPLPSGAPRLDDDAEPGSENEG